jgi:hypothetical protein
MGFKLLQKRRSQESEARRKTTGLLTSNSGLLPPDF